MLSWIARFRFVEADLLADRFETTRQRVNARLRRLEAAGLLARNGDRAGEARTIAVTNRGAFALGLPARKAPRTDVQREHERAIATLVIELERSAHQNQSVLTERECRHREATTRSRYSADVIDGTQRNNRARRWPDVVLEHEGHRTAFELELTPKGTTRLAKILAGYHQAAWFDAVRFLTPDEHIAARLNRLIEPHEATRRLLGADPAQPRMTVSAWPLTAPPQ
jgi:hypothetical protein